MIEPQEQSFLNVCLAFVQLWALLCVVCFIIGIIFHSIPFVWHLTEILAATGWKICP